MRYLLIRVATRKMLANLAVFGVVFSMLAPSPIERGADCDTERYPYRLSGKHKSNRTYSCARAYPVTSNARVSGFFIHGMECFAQPHSTVTLLARLRGLSTSVPLATAT